MFKRIIITILIAFSILIIISYFPFREKIAESPLNHQLLESGKKTLRINELTLTAEIADEPHERTQGLSGRETLADNQGMLFIFPWPTLPPFWMKDMKFPLDLLWINENGIIIEITKNVSPATFPQTFSPPSPILYVLEVNSGWSDKNKIKVGDKISL